MEMILGIFACVIFFVILIFGFIQRYKEGRGFIEYHDKDVHLIQEYSICDDNILDYKISKDNDKFVFVFNNLTFTLYSNQILFVFNPDLEKYNKKLEELASMINQPVLCYYSKDSVLCYNTTFLDTLNNTFNTEVDYHSLLKHLCSKKYGLFGFILKREKTNVKVEEQFYYDHKGDIKSIIIKPKIENIFPKIELKAIRF